MVFPNNEYVLLRSEILLDSKPHNSITDNKYNFFVGFPRIFDCKMNDKYLIGDRRLEIVTQRKQITEGKHLDTHLCES